MGLKIKILNVVLTFFNFFVKMMKIKEHQVAFVSLESKVLEADMKQIYDALPDTYTKKCVLTKFDKNSLWNNFVYFLNTIKQLYVINTSKVVIINDNNFVISSFKREGVNVIQVWHAAGAIKKFGNVIKRSYPIKNYDYVICNGEYWKEAYSQAFSVRKEQVVTTGMPRLDELVDKTYLQVAKERLYQKYPQLQGKKIILYAPTFRGDIYQGMSKIDMDMIKIVENLPQDYILLYKCHPLLNTASYGESDRIFNMNHEVLHDLFAISDCLVSDFSSIIFDFALLDKPIYAYVPDLDEYLSDRGCFVDYEAMMDGVMAKSEEALVDLLLEGKNEAKRMREDYVSCCDGHNLDRVVALIKDIMS